VSDYLLSAEGTRALCNAVVFWDELESSGEISDRISSHAASVCGHRHPARNIATEQDSGPTFAALAVPFINALVLHSANDLGRYWLISRLHGTLVEHQAFCPGELGVLRADIAARIEISSLSPKEKLKLIAGFDKILSSFTERPFAGAHIARNTESHTER
jgi:hypothetical protein